MKREFLKNLGIEDNDTISKILDENSADIGKAKGELQTYKDKVTELEGQITTLKGEKTTLESKVTELDGIKAENAQLKTDKETLTNELNTKVSQIQKTHAIENGVREAKAKNVKAVMALLDMEKITYNEDKLEGLSDQLTALQSGENTSFLFGEVKPSGANPRNPVADPNHPAPTGKTFAEAVASAFNANKN